MAEPWLTGNRMERLGQLPLARIPSIMILVPVAGQALHCHTPSRIREEASTSLLLDFSRPAVLLLLSRSMGGRVAGEKSVDLATRGDAGPAAELAAIEGRDR